MGDQFKLVKLLDGLNINISNNALSNYTATTMPGISDDNTKGYGIGSHWIDVSADEIYVAVDVSTNLAVWKNLSLDQTEIDHVNIQSIGVKTHATLDSEVNSLLTDQHTHANKALLDTYTQTDVDIADAITKEHVHANIVALDAVSGTNTGDQDLTSINAHVADVTTNPHVVTKTQVGLSNVVNSDTTTTVNITDSLNKRFMTDAQETNLDNQSGTNTGDQDLSSLVVGPLTSTDNAVARYDLTTGKLIQDSDIIISDVGDILANSSSQKLGGISTKFHRVYSKIGSFIGDASGTGVITEPSTVGAQNNFGGLMAGTVVAGGGTRNMTMSGGSYPAVMCVGNVAAAAGGTATLDATKGGTVVIGAAYTFGSGTPKISASGYGAIAMGYAFGNGASTIRSSGQGSLAFGYSNSGNSGGTSILSSGAGSFTTGMAKSQGFASSNLQASGSGAFCAGYTSVTSSTSALYNSRISASGKGSFAQGYSKATNAGGALARITASGKGSFAQGYTLSGTIEATATNAVQFGVGTNATPDSFQMGSGIHIEANGIIHWMKEIVTPAIPAANHHSVYFDVSGDDKMRIQDDLNNVEIVCSSVLIERQYPINVNQFRKGVTAPTDTTIGTTPTIPALRFSAINELVSLEVPIPDNWDNATDIKIRFHMNLVNAQTDLDTVDCTFDYVAPILNSTGNGITKTSSQVTSQVIVTTANGLAIADRYDMLVTIPFTDVNNGLLNAHAICLEMHLTNVTGVGSVDITGAHLIYTSEY